MFSLEKMEGGPNDIFQIWAGLLGEAGKGSLSAVLEGEAEWNIVAMFPVDFFWTLRETAIRAIQQWTQLLSMFLDCPPSKVVYMVPSLELPLELHGSYL